jgi:chromosomal replication initiation ATPase DnaA
VSQQLIFNLPYDSGQQADDFFVSDSNREAIDWLQRLNEWTIPGAVIYGAPGSGKTHLTRVWAAQNNAAVIHTKADIEAYLEADEKRPAVVDDADFFATDHDNAEALFHLYQHMVATDAKLLMMARMPAQQWQIELADCASRMRALPQIEIAAPDDQLVQMLLLKYFADRGIALDPPVIDYLVPRAPRSAPAIQEMVVALDETALAGQKKLNLAAVREYFKDKAI